MFSCWHFIDLAATSLQTNERWRSPSRRRRCAIEQRADRRLGCIAWFGLPWTRRKFDGVAFTRLSVGNNSSQVVFKCSGELVFNVENLVVYWVSRHGYNPSISSGEQISGGVYPLSRQTLSMIDRVSTLAMCRKFHVNRYCTPLTAAMEMCNASRGSVGGMPYCRISSLASCSALDETARN